ncbi:MAG: helix-turn-helix domain-containing protein [Leptolyngbyaceae cyanobacterium SM1_4_3]|nr:helix-turn-helix domain-containing protein [Leptolyngbyaceae cyanobacterium SM1_4_3]
MPRVAPTPLQLADPEREQLQQVIKRHSTPQQIAIRASIIVLERLVDAPRPRGPSSFSLEQIVQLFAIACEPPPTCGRPISHWTSRELADEMMKQGIVESISPRYVGRLMNEADLKPHQSQYWLNPPQLSI